MPEPIHIAIQVAQHVGEALVAIRNVIAPCGDIAIYVLAFVALVAFLRRGPDDDRRDRDKRRRAA